MGARRARTRSHHRQEQCLQDLGMVLEYVGKRLHLASVLPNQT